MWLKNRRKFTTYLSHNEEVSLFFFIFSQNCAHFSHIPNINSNNGDQSCFLVTVFCLEVE